VLRTRVRRLRRTGLLRQPFTWAAVTGTTNIAVNARFPSLCAEIFGAFDVLQADDLYHLRDEPIDL